MHPLIVAAPASGCGKSSVTRGLLGALRRRGLALPPGISRVYQVTDRNGEVCGKEGCLRGKVLGSYVHLHFASKPQLAENFVASCRRWRDHGR